MVRPILSDRSRVGCAALLFVAWTLACAKSKQGAEPAPEPAPAVAVSVDAAPKPAVATDPSAELIVGFINGSIAVGDFHLLVDQQASLDQTQKALLKSAASDCAGQAPGATRETCMTKALQQKAEAASDWGTHAQPK